MGQAQTFQHDPQVHKGCYPHCLPWSYQTCLFFFPLPTHLVSLRLIPFFPQTSIYISHFTNTFHDISSLGLMAHLWAPRACCPPPSQILLFCAGSFPGGSDGKESVGDVEDPGSIPRLGRSLGEENGYPLQYSCLENPMDRGACWATVRWVTESDATVATQQGHIILCVLHWIIFISQQGSDSIIYLSFTSPGPNILPHTKQVLNKYLMINK